MSHLTLLSLLLLICPKRKQDKLNLLLKNFKHLPAIKAFALHSRKIFKVQKQMQFCFVVFRKKNNQTYLVFDGSQIQLFKRKKCWSIVILQKKLKNNVKKEQIAERFPFINYVLPSQWTEHSIVELLVHQLNGKINSSSISTLTTPLDYYSTKNLLIQLNLWDKVIIYFCTSFLPTKKHVDWIVPSPSPNNDTNEIVAILEAFTGTTHQLAFALYTPPKHYPHKTKLSNFNVLPSSPQVQLITDSHWSQLVEKKNMSASVSLLSCGLTNGFCLGLIDNKSLDILSGKLNNTFVALWVHLDVEENVRHIAYSDFNLEGCKTFEISPPPNSPYENTYNLQHKKHVLSWNIFFDFLWQKHTILVAEKRKILQPLLSTLQQKYNGKGSTNTKYNLCLNQLDRFISKTKIIVFSASDKIMHALKLPFAFFAEQKRNKRNRGILLQTDEKNTIFSMTTHFMQIVNVVQFFGIVSKENQSLTADFYDDIDFKKVAKDWKIDWQFLSDITPMPVIDVITASLAKQTVYAPGRIILKSTFAKSYCNERGKKLAIGLHQIYAVFCQHFVQKYFIDLHTSNINSLPRLAFNVVWLQFNILGGPFLHSPERIKEAYAKLLGQFSRGGFSWSFGNKIESDQMITINNSSKNVYKKEEKAKSIIEFDICSSYGFAAANMSCPSGFCVGYIKNETDQLRQCDNFRHQYYEFRATYFFIHLLIKQGAEILSIYSNYHGLGIFCIAQYPIDLFVITKNLGKHLIQFDHMYTHGCRQGCPGLLRYAGNKSRFQVEKQSQERDNVIEQWIQNLNNKEFKYHVVSECHTKNFDKKNLDLAFLQIPILQKLVQPYLCLQQKIFALKSLSKIDPELTFIIFCQGHIPKYKQGKNVIPPIFVWKDTGADKGCQNWNQDFADKTETEIMLSQDHYDYLVAEHNFIVDSVLAILFFKKDHILPTVFEQLNKDRYLEAATNPKSSKVNVIKCLVNMACGFFGSNNTKTKKNFKKKWLVTGSSHYVTKNLRNYHFEGAGEFREKIYYTRTKLLLSGTAPYKITNSPLPIFCSIIDYGKLRLGQCFTFIETVARRGSFCLLYSHIDNMVLAISEKTFEKIVDVKKQNFYNLKKQTFFYQPTTFQTYPLAGQLKEEMCVSSNNWKFASPYPCFLALINPENETKNFYKMSSVSNISPKTAYDCALNYIDSGNPIFVTQQRRLSKISNTKTKIVHLKIKNKL